MCHCPIRQSAEGRQIRPGPFHHGGVTAQRAKTIHTLTTVQSTADRTAASRSESKDLFRLGAGGSTPQEGRIRAVTQKEAQDFKR